MFGTLDYSSWLEEVNDTNEQYRTLFLNGVAFPPLFFFGNPKQAVAATLGVNPSAQEFASNRKWTGIYDWNTLSKRCEYYFESPLGIPPHPWFEPWEAFLREVGLSYYKAPRTIHFDISPRATRSMGTLQNSNQADLFLSLSANDLKYLVKQLRLFPQIKNLYVAGSITKKYYIIEFLERYGKDYFSFEAVIPFERGKPGTTALYKFDLRDGITRFLFFCSTGPSFPQGKAILIQKAKWLKNYPDFIPDIQS